MNIRQHVSQAIRSGLAARIIEHDGRAGVLFLDVDDGPAGEFIAFANLGYNQTLGYFDRSRYADQPSEAENTNPVSIYQLEVAEGDPWESYLMDPGDGHLIMLGERWEIADQIERLARFLAEGETDGPAISEFDPAMPGNKQLSAADAAAYVIRRGYPADKASETIRRAAWAGRIPGASKDAAGNWQYSQRGLQNWLGRVQLRESRRKRG